MDKEKMIKYLKSKGWRTWYNDNYWVKEDLVDNKELDYTNYYFNLEDAYIIEKLNKNKLKIKNKYGLTALNTLDFLCKIGYYEEF